MNNWYLILPKDLYLLYRHMLHIYIYIFMYIYVIDSICCSRMKHNIEHNSILKLYSDYDSFRDALWGTFSQSYAERYGKISRMHRSSVREIQRGTINVNVFFKVFFFSFRARPETVPPIVCVKNNNTTANLSRSFIKFHYGRTFFTGLKPACIKGLK